MAFSSALNRRNCNQKTQEEEQSVLFFQCAHLILPWLTPSELANTSLTCKTLFQFSKSITISRSLDATRSFENLPIPFHNTLDDVPYAYFIYNPSQIIASSPSQPPQRQLWGSNFGAKLKPSGLSLLGHDSGAAFSDLVDEPSQNCKELLGGSSSEINLKPNSVSQLRHDSVSQSGAGFTGLVADPDQNSIEDSGPCSSGMSQLGAWGPRYEKPSPGCVDPVSVVDELGENECGCECEKCLEVGDDNGVFGCPCFSGLEDAGIVSECGPSCACGLECENRLSQRGISVRLKIVRAVKKGWGLFADQLIPRGQFICEYAGELLTTKETRRRQKIYDELATCGGTPSALLVMREHLPSGKACLRVNIDATRVGNVARFINHSCDGGNLSTILVRSSGALLPCLCFFASKDIKEGEELTFSYGEIRVRPKGLPCFCGSSFCFGILPSEHT